MVRVVATILLILLAAVLQTTWLARLAIHGVVPDPLLPAVLAIGLLRGPEEGAIFGLLGGLLQDLLGGTSLGMMGLSKLIIGFLAGYFTASLYLESFVPILVITGLGTLAHEVIWINIAHLTDQFAVPFPGWAGRAFLQAIYNAPMGPLAFAVLRGMDRTLSAQSQPSSSRGQRRERGKL